VVYETIREENFHAVSVEVAEASVVAEQVDREYHLDTTLGLQLAKERRPRPTCMRAGSPHDGNPD